MSEELTIKNKDDVVILQGIIIPVEWDDNGNAIAIAISTHGEEEFHVCNDEMGNKLFEFLQDSVTVKGQISEAEGKKLLKINEMKKCILNMSDKKTHSLGMSRRHKRPPKRVP